ncbi:MAG: tRNA (N6-threonylcarbamoyladenosine(37)-N6)-methyltransferase TrmO [bacterium]
MNKEKIELTPIGVIHTPFEEAHGTPIQPSAAKGAQGRVEILPEYVEALRDLQGFERIWLIYWFHKCGDYKPTVVPFRDKVERGLFATRAPARPNKIGMSVVKLIGISGNVLTVEGVDILDGTPLLDIKPYVPEFDSYDCERIGWLGGSGVDRDRADDRFE